MLNSFLDHMPKSSGILKFIVKAIFNKYVFVTVIFFGYLIFFDKHNLINKNKAKNEIERLEHEHESFQEKIRKNQELLNRLYTDTVFLEKFAREKYYMKRDNEDVFIFKE